MRLSDWLDNNKTRAVIRGPTLMRRTGIALLATIGFAHGQGMKGQQVMDGLDMTTQELARLQKGEVLNYTGEAWEQTDRELAADAVVLIERPLSAVLDQTLAETTLVPRHKILDFGELTGAGDFSGVDLDPAIKQDVKEAKTLLNAGAGKKLNLSDDEIAEIQKLAATVAPGAPDSEYAATASTALREILAARYRAYQSGGLGGLEPYARSKRKAVDVGRELRLTNEALAPVLSDTFPDYYDALVNYPASGDCCENSFYWLKVKISRRPTFALVHRITQIGDDYALVTERYYYATHSLNSLQVAVAWLPYESGTYMGLATSASADILTGWTGKLLRAIGRDKATEMVGEVLEEIKSELETEAKEM